ncbi:MAG: hypothetical protein ACLSAF_07300 [Intestinimonas sp.]
MNLLAALLPSIVLLVVLNVLDMGVTIACFVGIVVALVDFGLVQKRFRLKEAIALMGTGTSQAINSGFVTAMVIGFGSCVAATAGYAWIIEKLFNLPGPAEYQIVIAVAIAAAMSGSPLRRPEHRPGEFGPTLPGTGHQSRRHPPYLRGGLRQPGLPAQLRHPDQRVQSGTPHPERGLF